MKKEKGKLQRKPEHRCVRQQGWTLERSVRWGQEVPGEEPLVGLQRSGTTAPSRFFPFCVYLVSSKNICLIVLTRQTEVKHNSGAVVIVDQSINFSIIIGDFRFLASILSDIYFESKTRCETEFYIVDFYHAHRIKYNQIVDSVKPIFQFNIYFCSYNKAIRTIRSLAVDIYHAHRIKYNQIVVPTIKPF